MEKDRSQANLLASLFSLFIKFCFVPPPLYLETKFWKGCWRKWGGYIPHKVLVGIVNHLTHRPWVRSPQHAPSDPPQKALIGIYEFFLDNFILIGLLYLSYNKEDHNWYIILENSDILMKKQKVLHFLC